ncbi:MAG: hypothetical protein LH475_11150 [Cryobacterium sp.]|uniref:hypothetical protein n=1 Tax=unclassified Cryobacterium TaxID=2649013 RepID=UPI0018CB4344|nr:MULTISPECIES: hypothetical protein [unclassified Cryobacterium]MCY7405163.1 hypothetical protein [Cryobacterium sp.]MEC5155187.1 antitoxin component of MazEF toxin-antitoxin module [Cryobacterium sp. CAN_C3]
MRNRLTVTVSGLLLLLPLAGCAAEPVDLHASTAKNLQAAMLDITEAAAAGDFGDAQSLLTHMQANLRTAAAAGQVSAERSASIQSAINLVSADLTVEIDAAAVAAAAAAQEVADAAALAKEQNAEDRADDAKDAAEEAAQKARDAREECRKDKDRVGECN